MVEAKEVKTMLMSVEVRLIVVIFDEVRLIIAVVEVKLMEEIL